MSERGREDGSRGSGREQGGAVKTIPGTGKRSIEVEGMVEGGVEERGDWRGGEKGWDQSSRRCTRGS